LFTEKDKFILSEKSMFDSPERPKNNATAKSGKLPSRYTLIDKVHKWGNDIKDPLAVRQLAEPEHSDDEIIMTNSNKR
jgi:hypothetical protein